MTEQSHDEEIEQKIQDKGLNSPRVPYELIESLLLQVVYHYHVVPETCTTVCTAMLPMGNDFFTLSTESSSCASPANFDQAIGEDIAMRKARESAKDTLWLVEGYKLKHSLANSRPGKTLEELLKCGANEFKVTRSGVTHCQPSFYIHAINQDSETLDFTVSANNLKQINID